MPWTGTERPLHQPAITRGAAPTPPWVRQWVVGSVRPTHHERRASAVQMRLCECGPERGFTGRPAAVVSARSHSDGTRSRSRSPAS